MRSSHMDKGLEKLKGKDSLMKPNSWIELDPFPPWKPCFPRLSIWWLGLQSWTLEEHILSTTRLTGACVPTSSLVRKPFSNYLQRSQRARKGSSLSPVVLLWVRFSIVFSMSGFCWCTFRTDIHYQCMSKKKKAEYSLCLRPRVFSLSSDCPRSHMAKLLLKSHNLSHPKPHIVLSNTLLLPGSGR